MKRLPSLTRSQRRALLVIEWVLLIGIIVIAVWQSGPPPTPPRGREHQPPINFKERLSEQSLPRGGDGGGLEQPFETFPFDPNTADSTTLLRLGLSPWQVRSIYRYRAKHGRYHRPEDFKRVPGMTNEQWERLKSYIRIAPQFQYVQPPPRRLSQKETMPMTEPLPAEVKEEAKRDSFPRMEKLLPGQAVDINTADTSLLKMIPGIASKRAARIIAYRKALGGFVAVEQAMEATEMPDTVLRYMTVSALPPAKINVNRLSVQQMMKHPYLNFYQAKAIFEFRRNKGRLHSIDELSRLEAFKPTDIDRLRHYVSFE